MLSPFLQKTQKSCQQILPLSWALCCKTHEDYHSTISNIVDAGMGRKADGLWQYNFN